MATITPPGSATLVPCSDDPCPACVVPDPHDNPEPMSCEDCCARYAFTLAGLGCAVLNKTYTLDRFATIGNESNCAWAATRDNDYPTLARDADGNWAFTIVDLDGALCAAGTGARLVLTAAGTADVPCPPADPDAYAVTRNDFGGDDPGFTAIAATLCATGCHCFTAFESTYDCAAGGPWTDPVAVADYVAFADEADWHYFGVRGDDGGTVVNRRTVMGADAAACDGSDGACPRQATPAAPTDDPPEACPVAECPADPSACCQRIGFAQQFGGGFGGPVYLSRDPDAGTWSNGDGWSLTCNAGVWIVESPDGAAWEAAADPDTGCPPADPADGPYTSAAAWSAADGSTNPLALTSVICHDCPDTLSVTVTGGSCGTPLTVTCTNDGSGNYYSADFLSGWTYNGDGTWDLVVTDPADSDKFAHWTAVPGDASCPPQAPGDYGAPSEVGTTCGAGWTVSSIG